MKSTATGLFVASFIAAACTPSSSAGPPAAPSASPSATPSATASASPRATDTITTSSGPLTITPLEHASLVLGFAGKTIYLDPAMGAPTDGLPKADYVFITDIHADHMDAGKLESVRKPSTVVVAPQAVADKIPGVTVLANGAKRSFGDFEVEAVPMYNVSRGPSPGKLFHDKGRGDGFVFSFGGTRVYVSGDTECTPEMKALPNIDVAFVCMNLPYTMPPSEAAECVNAFKPKIVYPYHYRGSNLDDFKAAVTAPGVEVRVRRWYP